MGNDKREEKQGRMDDDDDEEIVCCAHGRPCRKAKEKRKKRTEEDRSEKIYENISEVVVNTESSNYEAVPDGGLGSEAEATPPGSDEDEEADISTAKEQDQYEDVSSIVEKSPKPKVFKRSEAESKVVAESAARTKGVVGPTCSVETIASFESQERLDKLDRLNPKEEEMIQFYVGTCTKKVAEEKCRQYSFRLYHRIDDSLRNCCELQPVLPLFIVTRSSSANYRHIRVLRDSKDLLHVNIVGEPKFYSMSALITFYDIYASFGNNLEPFPKKGKSSDISVADAGDANDSSREAD